MPRTAIPSACSLADAHVMLDPGHGPEQTGGESASGRPEFEFNDALAATIRRILRRRTSAKVSLTRSPEVEQSLMGRVVKTNRVRPDLMLSLHHDSVGVRLRRSQMRGDQVLATCEDHFGFSVYLDTVGESGAVSYRLARRLSDRLLAAGRPVGRFFYWGQIERGIYHGDSLFVLRNTQVPAVLLEAGFICNADEEERLADEDYQKRLAALIADAVIATLVETRCDQPEELDATGVLYPPWE